MSEHQRPRTASDRPVPGPESHPSGPWLRWHATPASPRGVLLFLHGGRSEDLRPVSRCSLAAARMSALRRAVTPRTAEPFLVASVRYRHRGWNGPRADAAADALHALTELSDRAGDLPIILIGHSMGARAALRLADHPHLAAVIALAPWCPSDEPAHGPLAATRLFLVHGDRDRITSPSDTWNYAERTGPAAHPVVVPGGDHAMLRHASAWTALTTLLINHCAPDARPLPEILQGGTGPLDAHRAIAALRESKQPSS